jgi:hypothetical protein
MDSIMQEQQPLQEIDMNSQEFSEVRPFLDIHYGFIGKLQGKIGTDKRFNSFLLGHS